MRTPSAESHPDDWMDRAPAAPDIQPGNAVAGGREDSDHPWLRMPDGVRFFLLGALAIYALVCVLGALSHTAENAASPYLAVSTFVYLTTLAIPLITFDRNNHGWFHPLVFGTLWTIVKSLPRRTEFFIFGLKDHAVLPLSSEDLTRLVAYENLLCALALVSLYAGFYSVRNLRVPRLRLRAPRRLWLVVAGAGVIGAITLSIYIRMSGSFSQHLINLSLNSYAKSFVTDNIGMIGLLSTTSQWFAMLLAVSLAYRPSALRKPFFWVLCLISLAMVYLAVGKRAALVNPIITGALVWMLTVRRVPVIRLLLLGAAMVAGFGFLLVVRMAATQSRNLGDLKAIVSENADESITAGLDELSYRLGGYSSVYPILYYVPDQSPLLWGSSYFMVLARPIPRAIWRNKPRGTDFRAGMTFFGSAWGIPPGPMAEAYWNFYIPGVIGVFFIFGLFYRWLANIYLKYRAHGIIVFFYAYALFALIPTEDGITKWLQELIPVILFTFAAGVISFRGSSDRGHEIKS